MTAHTGSFRLFLQGVRVPLVIDSPELVSVSRRAAYGILTAILWAVWIYLWLPLFSLLAWVFLGYRFADIVLPFEGHDDLLALHQYVLILLATALATALWSLYHLRRFGRHDRRHPAPEVTPPEVASYFKVQPQLVRRLRNCQAATLDTDESGQLLLVTETLWGDVGEQPLS